MTGHTFGGSALDRHVFEYETVADPTEAAPAADPVEAAPVADAPAPDAPAEAAPSWAGPSQDEWEETQWALQQMATALSANAPAPPAAVQPGAENVAPEYDPFDPESIARYNDWRDQQQLEKLTGILDQRLSPLASQAEAQIEQQNQELLKDAVHDTETRLGEFLGDDAARERSRQQMIGVARDELAALTARYGGNVTPQHAERLAEQALERAHASVKQYETGIGAAAVEAYKNQLSNLSGAPGEIAANGTAGVTALDRSGRDEIDFARHYAARA